MSNTIIAKVTAGNWGKGWSGFQTKISDYNRDKVFIFRMFLRKSQALRAINLGQELINLILHFMGFMCLKAFWDMLLEK